MKHLEKYLNPDSQVSLVYSKIIRDNYRIEHRDLAQRATKSRRGKRRAKEVIPDRLNIRLAFANDADRILDSAAYARSLDKTQVFFPVGDAPMTHRLLHSQFVAKISRIIARCLRLNQDLVEAIALAHDIGHTPFGCAGEEFLTKQLKKHRLGVFAYNAQSVRQLDRLENQGLGLNLTLQVLDGILCHNAKPTCGVVRPAENLSWEKLDENLSLCMQDEKAIKAINPSTLEGCVVQLANLISSAGRDVEDAVAMKIISVDDLPEEVRDFLGQDHLKIINSLSLDLITNSLLADHIKLSDEAFDALEALLEFINTRISQSPKILEEKDKLSRVFEQLFEACLDDLNSGDESRDIFQMHVCVLPEDYRQSTPFGRIACDFIASMTDSMLIEQYNKRFIPRSLGLRM